MTDPIQIESPQANINRARYAGKDFFTFVDDLIARIQSLFITEFNDFVTSGTGQMLIDIVAWAAETLSFYIDRQATESYLATARTRKAVNRLARQVGYKMAASVSAIVDLDVNLSQVYVINITIPVGFQFKGPNDLIFEAVESITFPAGEGPTSLARKIGVREGETRVETFVSDGSRNQIFRLNPGSGRAVAGESVTTRVDGVDWTEQEIITFDQTNQYEIGYNDEPPTLRFGDGVAGNVPSTGAEIRIEYVANSGLAGLVQSESIEDVESPLVVSATVIPLIITNPKPTSGGFDQESLTSAKINAPRVFKTRQVAVTREDYESLAGAFTDPLAGTVAVAQAFVARGAEDDLQLQILLSNIRAIIEPISEAVQVETAAIRADIQNTLDDNGSSGIDEIVTEAAGSNVALTALLAGFAALTASARTAAQDAKNRSNKIDVDRADIASESVTGDGFVTAGSSSSSSLRAAIAAVPAGSPSQLDTPELTAFNALLDLIDSALSSAHSSFALIGNEAADIAADTAAIRADANTIVAGMDSIDDATADATSSAAEVAAFLASIPALTADIVARCATLDALVTTSFENAVSDELDDIFAHVDSFLSDDCKANLIEVPVLTRNADGFLTEPPVALIRSLQSYLDARKEVTQVPEVVSGKIFLVPAVIEGTVGIFEGFVQQTVLSNVAKAVDDLLRVRAFGASLRKSDLDAKAVPNPQSGIGGVAGVKYAIFRILGHIDPLSGDLSTSFVDTDGNLVIDNRYVITKGTVDLVAETAKS